MYKPSLRLLTDYRGPIVRRINFLLSEISDYPVVAASVSGMLVTTATNPGDISKVCSNIEWHC